MVQIHQVLSTIPSQHHLLPWWLQWFPNEPFTTQKPESSLSKVNLILSLCCSHPSYGSLLSSAPNSNFLLWQSSVWLGLYFSSQPYPKFLFSSCTPFSPLWLLSRFRHTELFTAMKTWHIVSGCLGFWVLRIPSRSFHIWPFLILQVWSCYLLQYFSYVPAITTLCSSSPRLSQLIITNVFVCLSYSSYLSPQTISSTRAETVFASITSCI